VFAAFWKKIILTCNRSHNVQVAINIMTAGEDTLPQHYLFAGLASQDQHMFLKFSDEDYERQTKLHHNFFIRP
jgi:hypothetical protein